MQIHVKSFKLTSYECLLLSLEINSLILEAWLSIAHKVNERNMQQCTPETQMKVKKFIHQGLVKLKKSQGS